MSSVAFAVEVIIILSKLSVTGPLMVEYVTSTVWELCAMEVIGEDSLRGADLDAKLKHEFG